MTDKIMRQFSRIALSAGAAVVLTAATGCSNEIFEDGAKSGNTMIKARIMQPTDADGTRTVTDPTSYSDGALGFNWIGTDCLGVFGNRFTKNAKFEKSNQNEEADANFVGNFGVLTEKLLYAYYPYTPTAGTDPSALKGTLLATQRYNSRTREIEDKADWKIDCNLKDNGDRTYGMDFKHIFAFFRFDVSAPEGSVLRGEKLQSITLTMEEGRQLCGDFTIDLTAENPEPKFSGQSGTNQLEMSWTDTPELGSNTIYGYLSCAPQTGMMNKPITVKVTTDKHTATFTANSMIDVIESNKYYTINLNLLEREQSGWKLESTQPAEENAAWVSGLDSHLACANTVFAIAGQPFMHKIRVPQSTSQRAHAVVPVKTGINRVWNLPEGLTWNESRCLVQGTAPSAGDYVYSVEFTVGGTTYKEGIKLHVATSASDLISPTPMMGWQSWNVMEKNVSHDKVMAQAQQLKNKGFLNAGYNYVGIDDYWQKSSSNSTGRDSNGNPLWDTSKFPNGMNYTATALHNLGFKAGIYSDCGTLTCAGMYGSYGYETKDANAYASWGYDMLKEDWFWDGHGVPSGYSPLGNNRQAYELYKRMGDALKNTGRRFMLYMCEWGTHEPWRWAPEAGASCWRMSYDARDAWWGKTSSGQNYDVNDNGVGLHNTIVLMRNLWPYVGINRYNDADMLCVGIRGNGGSTNECIMERRQDNEQCDIEYETNFAMWCMWSSPLLLTLDMDKTINSHDQALLLNSELIAINQDALGQGAELVKQDGDLDYYMKDLANGDVAIAVVNLGDSQKSYTINLSEYEALSAANSYTVRNLLAKSDAGTLSANSPLRGSLAKHGTFIIRLSKN